MVINIESLSMVFFFNVVDGKWILIFLIIGSLLIYLMINAGQQYFGMNALSSYLTESGRVLVKQIYLRKCCGLEQPILVIYIQIIVLLGPTDGFMCLCCYSTKRQSCYKNNGMYVSCLINLKFNTFFGGLYISGAFRHVYETWLPRYSYGYYLPTMLFSGRNDHRSPLRMTNFSGNLVHVQHSTSWAFNWFWKQIFAL